MTPPVWWVDVRAVADVPDGVRVARRFADALVHWQGGDIWPKPGPDAIARVVDGRSKGDDAAAGPAAASAAGPGVPGGAHGGAQGGVPGPGYSG